MQRDLQNEERQQESHLEETSQKDEISDWMSVSILTMMINFKILK